MLYRFDPVTSTRLYKIEKDQRYQYHMHQKVVVTKGRVDSSHPGVSPRHRLIAQRSAERRKEMLKSTLAKAHHFESTSVPYSRLSHTSLTNPSSTAADLDPYASLMLFSPDSFLSPGNLNFLLSDHRTQKQSRISVSKSSKQNNIQTSQLESDEDILDIDLSSDDMESGMRSIFSFSSTTDVQSRQ